MTEPDPYCHLILTGDLAVEMVLDGPHVLAFHHPSPSFEPVHLMVIPKRHVRSLAELSEQDPEVSLALMAALSRLAGEVEDAHGSARVFTNLGNLQHSRHLHWHVVVSPDRVDRHDRPRNLNEQLWMNYWRGQMRPPSAGRPHSE